jgi:hypothetical protein
MAHEFIVCVPGPWADNTDFSRRLMDASAGEFTFMTGMLARPKARDHVAVDFVGHDPRLADAFRQAGQGRIADEILAAIGEHRSAAFLRFPLGLPEQRARLITYVDAALAAGGIAVKLESSGVVHASERWRELLNSEHPFDHYTALVTLIGGEAYFYSCGMHHFSLPECQVPRTLPVAEAAELMNQFNHYAITAQPQFATGQTFSLSADAPRFRLTHLDDAQHAAGHPFHNPFGVWSLDPE